MASRLQLLTQQFSQANNVSRNSAAQEKPAIKVTVTGASGNIGYSLVFMIGHGHMFGQDQPVELTLLGLPPFEKSLQGVIMELEDSALPLLKSLKGSVVPREGFAGCQVAILLGAKPRGPGMERKDLLGENGKIFRDQGSILNEVADPNCKVLVVGNPCNTNALIASMYAPRIPKENFTALMRLDHNRLQNHIALELGVNVNQVKNVSVWGNHSNTQCPDVNSAVVLNYPKPGYTTSVKAALPDESWIVNTLVPRVQKRGAEIIAARKKMGSGASAAIAICDQIYSWIVGTKPGEYVSMAVMSDGSYGVPKGIIFGFPVICRNGTYEIVQGLKWEEHTKKNMAVTIKELLDEREIAVTSLQNRTEAPNLQQATN